MKCADKVHTVLAVVVAFIAIYTKYRYDHPDFLDPLSNNFFCGEECGSEDLKRATNGWASSHFLMHATLGCMCPGEFMRVMVYALIWEILEFAYDYIGEKRARAEGRVHKRITKPTDTIVNMTGFMTGVLVNKIYRYVPSVARWGVP
jgi:hypothetical protein